MLCKFHGSSHFRDGIGDSHERIRESLTDFQGWSTGWERFLKVHGIEFINDSKATNVKFNLVCA